MQIEEIRALYQREQFRAFEIVLRGGQVLSVETRDHVWVTPAGSVHVVVGNQHQVFDRTRIGKVTYAESE